MGTTTGPVFAAALTLATGGLAAGAVSGRRALSDAGADQMTPASARWPRRFRPGRARAWRGPFNTWLRSPELADKLQQVASTCAFIPACRRG